LDEFSLVAADVSRHGRDDVFGARLSLRSREEDRNREGDGSHLHD